MSFTLEFDLITTSVEGVNRTVEIRFTEVLWHDGFAVEMILQAVDGEGNEMEDSTVRSVNDSDSIFK